MFEQPLHQPACDFFILQNRQYPRSSSLELVGNRYRLSRLQRQLLHRGVFDRTRAQIRRAKVCLGAAWQSSLLIVDGYNVQITVESAILKRPMLLANDSALRDLAGQSAGFRLSATSQLALQAIMKFLSVFPPREVLFLFDTPMSRSGWVAEQYRQQLEACGLTGDARTSAVPEKEFQYDQGVVASSDQTVIDASRSWLDLARRVIDWAGLPWEATDFYGLFRKSPGVQDLSWCPLWDRMLLVKKNLLC